MALSEMTVRHARITDNDYTLGDSDGLTLNVTASGGKVWLFRYYWTGKQKRPWIVIRKSPSKKRAPGVTRHAPLLLKPSILMSTVNSSAVLFVLRQSIPSRPCSISGWNSAG